MRTVCLALPLAIAAALPAAAKELTVIIQRGETSTQLFLSAPAEDLFALTATPVDVVPGGGGQVDTNSFISGTWEIGDALLARSEIRINGAATPFEAMSFMLHGAAEDLPLGSPLEAVMAIELCSVAEPGKTRAWNDLVAYAGYHARTGSEGAAISLAFPGGGAIPVRVIDAGAAGQRSWHTTLQPGTPLSLASPPVRGAATLWPFGLLAVLLALLGTALWARRTRLRRH